jgi:hypothetical protein
MTLPIQVPRGVMLVFFLKKMAGNSLDFGE